MRSSASEVPAGFERHFRQSPLTDPWEPLYSRRTGTAVVIGLHVAAPHTNARGLAHGGLISALADNAMGLSCGHQTGQTGLVTISLSVDFLAAARVGQWLEFVTNFVKTGRTICFAQCLVTADGEPCARASASFRVVPAGPAA